MTTRVACIEQVIITLKISEPYAPHMISQESRLLSFCALCVHAKKQGKKKKQTIYQKDETFAKCEQIKVYGK